MAENLLLMIIFLPLFGSLFVALSRDNNGTGISVAVLSGDWESGSVSGSGQSLRGLVDVENSELPDGIRVSSSRIM